MHHSHAVTTRSERVAQRSGARSFFANAADFLKSEHRGKFIVLMLFTSIALGCAIGAWNVPFQFRINSIVARSVICTTPFTVSSPEQKRLEMERARMNAPHVFVNDAYPLTRLRETLRNTVAGLVRANSYEELNDEEKATWSDFLRPAGQEGLPENVDVEAAFAIFTAHKEEFDFDQFQRKLRNAFRPFEDHGILMHLPFGPDRGSQESVLIYRKQDLPDQADEYKVIDVHFRDGTALREALRKEMGNLTVGDQLFNWIYPKLPPTGTLQEDDTTTAKVAEDAAAAVGNVFIEFTKGQILVPAGAVLHSSDINLLHAEYKASLANQTRMKQISRYIAASSVFFLLMLIIISLVFRMERRRPHTPQAFFYLMLGMIATVIVAQWGPRFALTGADWEVLPLMLFAMLISIVYSWELATILSTFLTIVIVCGNVGSINPLIVLLGTCVATAVQLGRLRSRRKLVIVGILSGLAAFFLTVTTGIQGDHAPGKLLFMDASINFLWALLAGLLMTGVLPFIERRFGILTDMSLLELGDVSHPLLRELIKVAPATYGHCTQVGAIAETAADAINARGLLTRVGAYFHDIGKIMKPEYFSENQGGHDNVHDTIEPQLSTIVLISHVKDGVDLARQFHLPQPIIDIIEQHHGTSLVSFFYSRATKGGKEGVEESTFRYPGPKPQSKEAAILMIADTCESACRSMGMGVQPNKVEAKIRALIKQKLDDGQFSDSGLTLSELKIIEKSVTGSIVAAMHGRIQYPDGFDKLPHHSHRDTDSGISSDMYQTGVHRADRMA